MTTPTDSATPETGSEDGEHPPQQEWRLYDFAEDCLIPIRRTPRDEDERETAYRFAAE